MRTGWSLQTQIDLRWLKRLAALTDGLTRTYWGGLTRACRCRPDLRLWGGWLALAESGLASTAEAGGSNLLKRIHLHLQMLTGRH